MIYDNWININTNNSEKKFEWVEVIEDRGGCKMGFDKT